MERIIEECELALQRILATHPNILKDINKSFELENPNFQLNRYDRKSVAVEPTSIAPLTTTVPGTVLITSLSLGFSVLWLLVHFVNRCFRSDKQWKQFIKKMNLQKNKPPKK